MIEVSPSLIPDKYEFIIFPTESLIIFSLSLCLSLSLSLSLVYLLRRRPNIRSLFHSLCDSPCPVEDVEEHNKIEGFHWKECCVEGVQGPLDARDGERVRLDGEGED